MLNIFKKINNLMIKINVIQFVLIITALSFAIPLILAPLYYIFIYYGGVYSTTSLHNQSIPYKFIIGSIIAPVIETLIFQYLPISFINQIAFLKNKNFLKILTSAALFGVAHYYNILAIFLTFAMGCLFAYAFIVYENKKESSFWVVTVIHSLRNTITTLTSIL